MRPCLGLIVCSVLGAFGCRTLESVGPRGPDIADGMVHPSSPHEEPEDEIKLSSSLDSTEEQAVLPTLPTATGTFAVMDATLLLGDGTRVERGTLLVKDGRIHQVLPNRPNALLPNIRRVDARGKFVTPGLIDTHSHLGVYAVPHVFATEDGNEATAPTTPEVFSEHGFWPQDPAIEAAVRGGVTTIQVLPGSANVIGGRSTVLKLRPRLEARAMRFPGAPFGLKMACGENPKRVYGKKGQRPASRMGNIAVLREAFIKADAYRKDQARHQVALRRSKESDKKDELPPKGPDRSLALETLSLAMDGRIRVHVHCYRADEMLLMISLAEELGFTIASFHHAVEAYKIADVLRDKGIPASVWADWWGFKMEAYDGVEENAAILHAAGALPIIHSDSEFGIQRLNQEASKAMHAGRRLGLAVSEDQALMWITSNPAKALGVHDRAGTLTPGKAADFVIWDQNPFSVYARAERVYIDGIQVVGAGGAPWSDFSVTAARGSAE
jgi:imidazolonepropionase-like amidohydrolase